MNKLTVQLPYQDKPSYIRAIENADFYLTNDIRLALDAYKEKRTKAKIEQLKKAA